MKNVKAPASESYHPYLLSQLADPAFAAVYLETHFEEGDESVEPELLKMALTDVLEALGHSRFPPDEMTTQLQMLDRILVQPGHLAIPALATWLNRLGLTLTVSVKPLPNQS